MRGKLAILSLLASACAADGGAISVDGGSPDARLAAADASPDVSLPAPALLKARTEYLGRLVGTSRTPLEPLGLIGTDLGASFERDGKLVFLFGDSWTVSGASQLWNDDSVAFTAPAPPGDRSMPPLSWMAGTDGRFLPLRIPGVSLGAMEVPVEAVPVGPLTYLFASSGWSDATGRHATSALAHTTGLQLGNLTLDHKVDSEKFINVSVVADGATLWIFGSGAYRKSAVYLARVEAARLGDRRSWTYYTGRGFDAEEQRAVPVVAGARCVGELSVRKHPTLGLYLMAYNCGEPRGIVLHVAAAPTGPWSEGQVIFAPGMDEDHGYGHFMHAATRAVGFDDGLSEPGRDEEWGGEYGPYLIPSFFTEDAPGVHSIVYTLSSWNPYSVHLLRTVLHEPGAAVPPPINHGAGLPATTIRNGDFATGTFEGWQSSGDGFAIFTGSDGARRVTTFVNPKGDGAIGRLWQDFTVDDKTSEITFSVHGGHASVRLYHGADLVKSTHGRDTNDVELPVRWQIAHLRGETLRLVIEDDQTGPWGFIGATGFRLR